MTTWKKGDIAWACKAPTGLYAETPRPERVTIRRAGTTVKVDERVMAFGCRVVVPAASLFRTAEEAVDAWCREAEAMAQQLDERAADLRASAAAVRAREAVKP